MLLQSMRKRGSSLFQKLLSKTYRYKRVNQLQVCYLKMEKGICMILGNKDSFSTRTSNTECIKTKEVRVEF